MSERYCRLLNPAFAGVKVSPPSPVVRIPDDEEAMNIRRRELGILMAAVWTKAKARIAQSLKNAGAQPVKPQGKAA